MGRVLIDTVGLVKDYYLGTHTVHALRGVSVRVEAGARSTVEGGERSAVTDLKACQ